MKVLETGKNYLLKKSYGNSEPFRITILEVTDKAYHIRYDSDYRSWVDRLKYGENYEIFEELGNTYYPQFKNLIDYVTVEVLDVAFRLAGIEISKEIIDRIIDLVEVVEQKHGEISLKDIILLKRSWNKD